MVNQCHNFFIFTLPPKAYFQTVAKQCSRLNKVAVLFEYAVDAEGNKYSEYREWK